ncbi:MAG: NUDIX hydrolase [Raoultibacter sp.]|jgi:8-oxo-dGTP pyrophosphatase MutT (NUDIX family)
MELMKANEYVEMPDKGAIEKAEEYLSSQDFTPVEPRYAATVMLVRDSRGDESDAYLAPAEQGRSKVEVFMLRRAKTMAFVPDAVVFPGGRVDERDSDPRLPWSGPAPSEWAKRLGCDEQTARCIVVAAAREVFEECGVLLAGKSADQVVSNLTDPLWDTYRVALEAREKSFSEMLIEENLMLRSDLLGLRSNWLTPKFEARRYNTFFFAALLPEGQTPDDRTSEATIADWVDPLWAFDLAQKDQLLVLPPTRYNLAYIANAQSAAQFVAENPKIEQYSIKASRNEQGEVVFQCALT